MLVKVHGNFIAELVLKHHNKRKFERLSSGKARSDKLLVINSLDGMTVLEAHDKGVSELGFEPPGDLEGVKYFYVGEGKELILYDDDTIRVNGTLLTTDFDSGIYVGNRPVTIEELEPLKFLPLFDEKPVRLSVVNTRLDVWQMAILYKLPTLNLPSYIAVVDENRVHIRDYIYDMADFTIVDGRTVEGSIIPLWWNKVRELYGIRELSIRSFKPKFASLDVRRGVVRVLTNDVVYGTEDYPLAEVRKI